MEQLEIQPGTFSEGTIACCDCGTPIAPNPANMCLGCVRARADITEGIPKQSQLQSCRNCERFFVPPNAWNAAKPESKELMALCLARLKPAMAKVRLVDAAFVWTEPHSKRVKVKLTIQKEVFSRAVLQQSMVVEFVLLNQMCDDCRRFEAKDYWRACVQVRQRCDYKKTLFYLEQLLIKHNAQAQASGIKPVPTGIDFFFARQQEARKLVDFISSALPSKFHQSQQLVTHDVRSNFYDYKHTFCVDIVPITKDALICLPRTLAQSFANIGQFVLCLRVTDVVSLINPQTLQLYELNATTYWKNPFDILVHPKSLVEFFVVDVEEVDDPYAVLPHGHGSVSTKHRLADVWVVRSDQVGHSDAKSVCCRSHLGHLLNAGDTVLGYNVCQTNLNNRTFDAVKEENVPDVVLIRKAYDRSRRLRKRQWRLKRLLDQEETASVEREFNEFMDDIEEDPALRERINIYKKGGGKQSVKQTATSANRTAAQQRHHRQRMASAAADSALSEDGEEEHIEGAPTLAEMLDDLDMDFVDHIEFNPCSDVGEPFDERQSRRDLHTGPPRRRGDFYGLDYTTMLPDGQWRQPSEWEAEDAQNYHGYQALPPRKNFRLCGRYTADPDAPLNIAEADGLDELNSDYLVGNTLANQRCVTDRELTDEEKRTFALLYGPGGFKPDHVTIRPDPLPEEPPVFSTTIGPQKSRSAADISPTPQGYVNPMKVEGESWMLGRRSEQGNYGLASSGEQPPFVRPARFPPHVPQWAKDRQFSMTRGAKSVDRSLFAPSWAKVPQPQPPYWVKRTEDGKGVGAVQKGKAWEEEEEKEKHDEMGKGQRVGAVQTQQQQQQRQPTQQQMEQQMVKLQQNQLKQSQQTQGQRIGQTEQLMPKQNQMQQQFRAVQQQKAQQPPQQFEYEKGIMQKTTVVTTVEITEEPQEDNQPQEEQQRVGAVQQKNEQKQWPINRQQQQQVKQQQRPQQQQIATTKTNATGTEEHIANGTPKHGQTQQWRQQQQQPTRQVQAAQQQIEKMPAQQRAFDKPGGIYYFHEKRTEDKRGEKEGEKQTEQRIVTKQQQQKVPSTEASSGLENLKMPKLGEFPALPDGGKRFTGPTEQQMVRHRNAPPQQQQPKEGQTVRQQMPKFPTGRRWSKEPQEGDVFVDGFGRPVHYVREMVVDPRTGEAVTREEWRLADERRTEEEGEGQNGDSLPANSSRHFRQQIITKSTQNSVKQ